MNKTPSTSDLEQQIALLQAQVASLSRDNELLAKENARIVKEAQEEALAAKTHIESLEVKIERLIEQIKLSQMRYFGSRSEKVVAGQLSLFNDIEAASNPDVAEPHLEEVFTPTKPRRRGGKRKLDTTNLERIVIEHTIENPTCPQCDEPLHEMKVEVTEVVKLVPAHLVVEEHRRHVYRCDACCEKNANGAEVPSVIRRAPMPVLSPIPHSFASASLIASVLNSKYSSSMPLYRIEQEFESLGIAITRQTMANWVMNVHERWLSLVHARMKEKLLEENIIHADETEVQVLKEPSREAKAKSRMWLFRSAPRAIPNCIFEYHPTRSKEVAETFLRTFKGYLVTDGYSPYFNLSNSDITNVACLVHIRRKFAEIVKTAGGDEKAERAESVALAARRRIDKIFHIDKSFDTYKSDERKQKREEKLTEELDSFETWAKTQIVYATPRLALHDALSYALKYWPYVKNVLRDGNLELDNNCAERAIKSFVIGRKNFLFSDTPRGAHASAAIYSIIITAKLNGLNQRAYLEWLLTEMPNDDALDTPEGIDKYLPWSEAVPKNCRLSQKQAQKAAELKDDPIVDKNLLEALQEIS